MKKYKKLLPIAAAAILLLLAADWLLVSGSEFSWAESAHDEVSVTVEVMDTSGTRTLAVHELTRGQGVALQSLLLRTKYLRHFSDMLRVKNGSNTYRILIRLPDRDVSLSLDESDNGWYLGGGQDSGWLKILDKDWETAFTGILAAS